MECKKCEIEVPSQFEYVLSRNVCPKCGNKLMADGAMKVYMDLKKRLDEVEFVMDKATVCERVAMFVITNYEVTPLDPTLSTTKPVKTAADTVVSNKHAVDTFKAQLASLDEDPDLTAEEIRAQEALRAEDIAAAREMGMDMDELGEDEELVSGTPDADRIQRLKKLAMSSKAGAMVRRIDR